MIEFREVRKLLAAHDRCEPRCWSVEHLAVAKGERVLVTGPSGCGKTTFLNLWAGLHRPDAGSVAVNSVRVDQLSTSKADLFRGLHIGMIFQSLHLLAPFSALDNVLLGARFGRKWKRREAVDRAKRLFNQVGLSARMTARPNQLSIGEQQRVAIARALINEPLVLVADEPTSSLDAAGAANVLDLLFELCASHDTTLVTVSHDTRMAGRFDRQIDASAWMSLGTAEAPHA